MVLGAEEIPWRYCTDDNPDADFDDVDALIRLLGGHGGHDVLALLSLYYHLVNGRIDDLMKHPDVAAHFANWRS